MPGSSAAIVGEYNLRSRLAKLGYTSPLSELSQAKAEAFALISSEIDRLQIEESKRGRRR